jgi:hypothetical protein
VLRDPVYRHSSFRAVISVEQGGNRRCIHEWSAYSTALSMAGGPAALDTFRGLLRGPTYG